MKENEGSFASGENRIDGLRAGQEVEVIRGPLSGIQGALRAFPEENSCLIDLVGAGGALLLIGVEAVRQCRPETATALDAIPCPPPS